MVGLERAVLPLVGERDFELSSRLATLAFIASFGATKAVANLAAGVLADRAGRRRVLLAGWGVGLFVPLLIIAAPSWDWIVVANALLGLQQGLCWSMTVVMKMDLVGGARRGLALGLNESAGYIAMGLAAFAGAKIAEATSLRPEPFVVGALIAAIGGLLSVATRDTRGHARLESAQRGIARVQEPFGKTFADASWRHPALFSASQAGFANNLNDGIAWGLLPAFFLGRGLDLGQIGLLVAVYPAIWGLGQIASGAASDRLGRRPLIVAGMLLQAGAIAALVPAQGFPMWLLAMALLGIGTALVYPTLLAVVADVAAPQRRASTSGVYRFWRDAGYVCGALGAGAIADARGLDWAIEFAAAVTFLSGLIAVVRLPETARGPAIAPGAHRLERCVRS
jgi:MFS family permease